ncbi:hypothetical protein P7C73_g2581, partial [Tremellales sp. Uapishka_1]
MDPYTTPSHHWPCHRKHNLIITINAATLCFSIERFSHPSILADTPDVSVYSDSAFASDTSFQSKCAAHLQPPSDAKSALVSPLISPGQTVNIPAHNVAATLSPIPAILALSSRPRIPFDIAKNEASGSSTSLHLVELPFAGPLWDVFRAIFDQRMVLVKMMIPYHFDCEYSAAIPERHRYTTKQAKKAAKEEYSLLLRYREYDLVPKTLGLYQEEAGEWRTEFVPLCPFGLTDLAHQYFSQKKQVYRILEFVSDHQLYHVRHGFPDAAFLQGDSDDSKLFLDLRATIRSDDLTIRSAQVWFGSQRTKIIFILGYLFNKQESEELEHGVDAEIAHEGESQTQRIELRGGAGVVPVSPSSEEFYAEAVAAFPSLLEATGFEYKRAKALLAILCIQYGLVREHLVHLGDYVTLCSIDGFHNEAKWPDLSRPETEERRRVVFSAITWGGVIRHRESHSNVSYPTEVEDDRDITADACKASATSFLRGWNFTTDLYRMLEHLVDKMRSTTGDIAASPATDLFSQIAGPPSHRILEMVDSLYDALPAVFKATPPMTGNTEVDRFGFQGRQVVESRADLSRKHHRDRTDRQNGSSGRDRLLRGGSLCDSWIAPGRVDLHTHGLHRVDQLADVRNVIQAMADLLSGLENTLSFDCEISSKLRMHITRIDSQIAEAALRAQEGQVFHAALPRPSLDQTSPSGYPHTPAMLSLEGEGWPMQLSPAHQVNLQEALMSDWPYNVTDSGLYTFLGDWQSGLLPETLPNS